MKFDLRYNLQHIGDIFVGAVQKTADSAMQCSKGVFLTYDIKKHYCKKQKVSREIGERVSLLIKEGTIDVSRDTTLSELIVKLNDIEKALVEHENERRNLINPFKAKKSECMTNS
ncbi:MAG: hypothetical protein WCP20_23095 [Desulfuromonadales bacterium]